MNPLQELTPPRPTKSKAQAGYHRGRFRVPSLDVGLFIRLADDGDRGGSRAKSIFSMISIIDLV